MSKEMTPKDALEGIIWRLTSYEDDLELRETDKKEIEIITQSLDRLEELEKENKELKDKISKFEKPILYMCRDRRSKELERLRLLEVANIYNVPILLSDVETVEENTKLKKVIDILKTKRVNVDYLLNSSKCATYNFFANKQEIFQLTQQEYDLLKEVLE